METGLSSRRSRQAETPSDCPSGRPSYYYRMARRAAFILLSLAWFGALYRAAVRSVSIDEAYTYNLYLSQPLGQTFTLYDANNHVLFTLLARVCVNVLGASELALRLPALASGALYFWALWRLASRSLGSGWWFFLAVSLAAVNPLVLDFVSAARGYSLALSLFCLGLERLEAEKLEPAGVALGFAIAANLTIAVPSTAAIMLWAARQRTVWAAMDRIALPSLAWAGVLLILPLANANRENFYAGHPTLVASIESLAAMSFPSIPEAVPAAVTASALLSIGLALRVRRDAAAAVLMVSLALLALLRMAGLPYPVRRTGLYLIPQFLLGAVSLFRNAPSRAVRGAGAATLATVAALFALQWRAEPYLEWGFNAGDARIVQALSAHRTVQKEPVRVCANWLLEGSLNFYRQAWRLDWMAPVSNKGLQSGCDYYVLLPEDGTWIEKAGLTVLYTDHVSRATLAARRN